MKKLFEKHETLFCILLIVVYVVVNSVCLQNFGMADLRTVAVNTLLSLALLALVLALGRGHHYGLTPVMGARHCLYFLPLALVASVNLWGGLNFSHPADQILFHILNMINVGFIEEIIFRGFLFRMMEKTNVRSAITVSALTFGIGHIVNLFNGAEVIPTLLQILSATAMGYLFVIIFHRTRSLIPCIAAHIVINATSIFAVERPLLSYISTAAVIVIAVGYGVYIDRRSQGRGV